MGHRVDHSEHGLITYTLIIILDEVLLLWMMMLWGEIVFGVHGNRWGTILSTQNKMVDHIITATAATWYQLNSGPSFDLVIHLWHNNDSFIYFSLRFLNPLALSLSATNKWYTLLPYQLIKIHHSGLSRQLESTNSIYKDNEFGF
ncbi:unnamed protein product [Absidia cylindrospora]